MAVGDRYRVIPVIDLADVRAVMVHNFMVSSQSGNGAGAQAIAEYFDELLDQQLKSLIPSVATYRGIKAQRYYPAPPDLPRVGTAGAGVGLAGPECLSPQTAGLITWRTLQAGRAFRGRSYVPFPTEGSNDATGRPSAGYQNALLGYANLLLPTHVVGAGGDTSSLILILQSQEFTVDQTPITSAVIRDYWGTIRRRGRAQGPDVTGPL